MNTLPVTLVVTTNVTIRNDLGLKKFRDAYERSNYLPDWSTVNRAKREVRRALVGLDRGW